MRRIALSFILLCGGATATPATETPYGPGDFARVHKFDAHVHANTDEPAFLDIARADNVELLTINVDYPDFPTLDAQAAIARELRRRDPQRIHFATTFLMAGWSAPGWAEAVNDALTAAVAQGAVAVKIWKNIGMVERDPSGRLLAITDSALDPVVRHIETLGVPLIAHQGEPHNCWLPLSEMTTDNDRSYFAEHPQYHMYLHPELPSYERLMSARDQFVGQHPNLSFVGAHLASLEWNVDRLATFLDEHPNAVVDMAARMTQLQYQSVRNRARVRRFLIRYQDRVLYGTDLTIEAHARPEDVRREAHEFWKSDWLYLATRQSQYVAAIRQRVPGLALPRSVIDKIYLRNAKRVFIERSPTG